MPAPVQLVWLKRDLRLHDHAPLAAAAKAGRVVVLYIVEPELWRQPDTSRRHYRFIRDSAEELDWNLRELGGQLTLRVGEATAVLEALREELGPFDLHAHQETGNGWTYARDRAVRRWCADRQSAFHEPLQFGVWRGRKNNREGWAGRWDAMMRAPQLPVPASIDWQPAASDAMPPPEALGLRDDGLERLQRPGREAGLKTLQTFLEERGRHYRTEMSSPVTGEHACSRLSVHLAYGTLSMREILQAAEARLAEVRAEGGPRGFVGSLNAFIGRLHWHCHFMQKLETEPALEHLPMARVFTGLRGDPGAPDPKRMAALEAGLTGYPFLDACCRSLRATGWINFRMRALLMSFASYDLWLPWQASGELMARWYTDYEPGIHWPQSQMQSGVTGINALRIYSPVKQGLDQDPSGDWTRRWVPELAGVPGPAVHEPWKAGGVPGYPEPIVDHLTAQRAARAAITEIKRTPEARMEAKRVYALHGSRKRAAAQRHKRDARRRKRAGSRASA